MRNGSLWSDYSFRERNNFPRIWFRDLRFRIWGLKIKHLKAHSFVWQGVFSFIIISQPRRPIIELKFLQVCHFTRILRYTKWKDWSLTITNNEQVFKILAEGLHYIPVMFSLLFSRLRGNTSKITEQIHVCQTSVYTP